jgi:hypothetical protein
MRNIRENLIFAFAYNADRHPNRRRRPLPNLRHPSQSDHRRARDVAQLCFRDRERPAIACA